jgi:hypothetical protein
MSYVFSSPWTDAANYGRGLGDSISQALINKPQQQQQQMMQLLQLVLLQKRGQQEQENEQKRLGIEKQNADTNQSYRSTMAKTAQDNSAVNQTFKEGTLKNQQQRTADTEAKQPGQLDSLLGTVSQISNILKTLGVVGQRQPTTSAVPHETMMNIPGLGNVSPMHANAIAAGTPDPLGIGRVQSPLSVAVSNQLNAPFQGQQPQAAAAPQTNAVPPPEGRVPGKVYQLPKGNFQWTTQGWMPVQ